MDSKPASLAAAAGLVAILPAALFMTALVVRNLSQLEFARPAQQIVMWYSDRMWALWLLLLALPCGALVTGCAALAQAWRPRVIFVATTLISAVILAIVVLHMAAN